MIDMANPIPSQTVAKRQSRRPAVEPLAVSAADVARMLSVSVRQIWAMHSAGTLGPTAISLSPRLTRWDRLEIEAWWAACRAAGRTVPRAEWLAREGAGR